MQLNFECLDSIQKIEEVRNSRVLIFASTNFDMDILPKLYNQLISLGRAEKLDIIIHSRGGVVNVARRIAILCRKFSKQLNFIVPYYCESSGTLLTLSADEIIATDMSIFTPIDPHLHGGNEGETNFAMSILDLQQFGDMCKEWFGVTKEDAGSEQLSILCNSIFPPSLTSFYRTTLETRKITEELLSLSKSLKPSNVDSIVEKLIFGFNSHHYPITAEEMFNIGMNIKRNFKVESYAWKVSEQIQSIVGGGVRRSLEEPWCDVILADKNTGSFRVARNDGLQPEWRALGLV